MSKLEELQRRAVKLREELKVVEKEQERLKNLPPEAVLENLFENPKLRSQIATAVFEMTGKDRNKSAKILRTSVSDLHNALNEQKEKDE